MKKQCYLDYNIKSNSIEGGRRARAPLLRQWKFTCRRLSGRDVMEIIWSNEYIWDKGFHLLNAESLRVPGLHMFGHAKFTRVNKGLKEHYHPGCMEITVFVKGSQRYAVNGQEYDLAGGDVYTTFLEEGHSTGGNPIGIAEYYWFQLDMREKEGFLGLRAPYDAWLYEKAAAWSRRVVRVEFTEIALLRSAFEAFSEGHSGSSGAWIRGQSAFVNFLTGLLESESDNTEITEDIQKIIQYIDECLPGVVSLQKLAEISGYSVSHMRKKFREQTGVPLREYINMQRIEIGKKLLQEGATVTETAICLNFGSSNYFSSVFRQFTGRTPTEYREEYVGNC